MSGENVSLAIALEDGRQLVAVPGPEDQERLAQLGFSDIVSLAAVDTDTSGHLMSSDVMVDVEGHAMTLRLPTNADAEALKRALAVGAVTATLVAAGTIAALQGGPAAPAVPQTVTRPNAGPPAAEFQLRREQQVDKMLAAPAPIVAPTDIQTERLDRISAPSSTGGGATTVESAKGQAPSTSFEERKDRHTDEMLDAPEPLAQPSDVSTN